MNPILKSSRSGVSNEEFIYAMGSVADDPVLAGGAFIQKESPKPSQSLEFLQNMAENVNSSPREMTEL